MKKNEMSRQPLTMPLLALRGLAVFPNMILHFDVGRKKSILAVSEAMKNDQMVYLVAQKDIRDDEPTEENLYSIGTVAKIRQILHLPEGNIRVLVEGSHRAQTMQLLAQEPYIQAMVTECESAGRKQNQILSEAMIRKVQEMVSDYSEIGPKLPEDVFTEIMADGDSGRLADFIASNIFLKLEDKQVVLEELNPRKRLMKVLNILEREIGILNIEQEISEKIHDQVDKNQREYYIREQIKVLSGELGEADNPQDEAAAYHKKIDGLKLKEEAVKRLHAEADRLMKMPSGSHEATVIRNWLDTCLSLPWNKSTKDKIDLGKARKVLDEDHYGLEKVKDRMIEFLAVKKLTSKLNGQIVCLVGPPGVGKTSIARSIAKAMGRHYIRVSLGGVRDEADIRGHRKTYIGAMPGRIIHALELAGTNNPLMLLDEVDKMSADFRGDPSSALLEVLDSEQNNSFRDHYVELPFDLSNVMFLTTANDLDSIPEPLLDRMEIITLSTYTREEKYHIALEHLLQKQLKKHGLNKRMLKIKEDSIYALIDFYTRESGVRNLERQIASICRKAAKQIAADGKHQVVVAAEDLEQLLGPKKYKQEPFSRTDEVGVVTGLAWTSVGGETMPIEVCVMEGSGKLELTGSLGDVMKESAKAAVSFIRSRAGKLMVDADFYKEKDIHIHVPEGAIPKDGPSAGVTMATALVSALSGRKVRHDVAMTGEITLSGRVLPIGGLREKTMAAYRDGIKTVIIPEENRPDLADVDSIVKEHIRFIPVSRVESVFETAIINPDEKKNDQVVGKATIINTIPVVDAQLPVIRQ